MKKIMFALTVSAAILSSSFTYAAEKDPGARIKQAFKAEFSQVKDVEWSTFNNESVYQAKFTFNNEPLQAFFSEEGEFLGTTREITKTQLPILVATQLEKQYSDSRVITIYEYSKKEGLDYYITLTSAKGSMVVKATGNGDISVFKKTSK